MRVRPFMENESRENGLVVRGNRVHIRSCNREVIVTFVLCNFFLFFFGEHVNIWSLNS